MCSGLVCLERQNVDSDSSNGRSSYTVSISLPSSIFGTLLPSVCVCVCVCVSVLLDAALFNLLSTAGN